jgi:hypothetical protein
MENQHILSEYGKAGRLVYAVFITGFIVLTAIFSYVQEFVYCLMDLKKSNKNRYANAINVAHGNLFARLKHVQVCSAKDLLTCEQMCDDLDEMAMRGFASEGAVDVE